MKRADTVERVMLENRKLLRACGKGGSVFFACVRVLCVRPIAFPSVGPDKGGDGRRSALAREAVTVPAHRVRAHPSRCLAVSLRSSLTN